MQLQTAIAAGRLGLWEWDLRSGRMVGEGCFEALCGLPPGGFDGRHETFERCVHPDDRARLAESLQRARERCEPFEISYRVPGMDGAQRWLTMRGTVERGADGKPERMAGAVIDITAQLAALHDAQRELDTFAYSVGHDLRAPLRAIAGFSEVLLQSKPGELEATGREFLPHIATAATRMSELVGGLVELSRIASLPLERTDVDLSAMVRDELTQLRASEPERHVETDVADGCAARADAVLIRLVLHHLIANAWKFTRYTPMPRIEFGHLARVDGDAWFVRDNGAGFDGANAERLFQPFQRLHRADEFEGLGTGLALARRVIERHGGAVWAEGQPGGGACFWFSLS